MARVRPVQELAFDGAALFCPRHPGQKLMQGPKGGGKVQRICFASLAAGCYCWNTAEWPSEKAMRNALREAGFHPDA